MTSSDTAPVASRARSAPPTAFGQGFVLDTWYFVALSRDVKPASLKRHELLGEPVLIGRCDDRAPVDRDPILDDLDLGQG